MNSPTKKRLSIEGSGGAESHTHNPPEAEMTSKEDTQPDEIPAEEVTDIADTDNTSKRRVRIAPQATEYRHCYRLRYILDCSYCRTCMFSLAGSFVIHVFNCVV